MKLVFYIILIDFYMKLVFFSIILINFYIKLYKALFLIYLKMK